LLSILLLLNSRSDHDGFSRVNALTRARPFPVPPVAFWGKEKPGADRDRKPERIIEVKRYLDFATVVFALAAAVFWFLSAYETLPPMISYWGQTPPNDPFFVAMKQAAWMNTLAAFFSCLSASSMGVKIAIG
jgi:hypothetical protein